MSISLYYTARRERALSELEHQQLMMIARDYNESFEFDYETLYFYPATREGEVLTGSTKISMDPEEVEPSLLHWFAALSTMRRSLPDAVWEFSLDETDIEWDDELGYYLEGLGA